LIDIEKIIAQSSEKAKDEHTANLYDRLS
jgi:hypothetical protein